jgi:1-deoxy-D-xylulose-5-phosphate reductoisomerase
LQAEPAVAVECLDTVLVADGQARNLAERWLAQR